MADERGVLHAPVRTSHTQMLPSDALIATLSCHPASYIPHLQLATSVTADQVTLPHNKSRNEIVSVALQSPVVLSR